MEKAKQFKGYTDFLHDEEFIVWVLTKDKALGQYWKDFLNLHPECTELFNEAVRHSASIRMNRVSLPAGDREALRLRIHASLHDIRRKRRRRLAVWQGVAAAILLAGVIFFFFRVNSKAAEAQEKQVAVMWQELDEENIRFVHGDSVSFFPQNVRLLMGRDGSAVVFQPAGTERIRIEGAEEVNELAVPYGKRSKVKLEDGTEVWLNSGSTLRFPVRFTGREREVTLNGEMYVEVATDSMRPFVVHTGQFDVRVSGTKFNISAYAENDAPYCVLAQGEVTVRTRFSPGIVMKPDEIVVCHNRQLTKRPVRSSRYTCWKDGYLELDDSSLSDVLRQIGRYYNISFDFTDKARLNGKKSSGKIYLSDNVDNVLKALSLLYSVDFSFPD